MNLLTWLIAICIGIFPWLAIACRNTLRDEKIVSIRPQSHLLVLAALIYPIARLLPEPDIFADTNTLLQHFIGGGFVSYIYYLYFARRLGWRNDWYDRILIIFAFVSCLGVANELLEFLARAIGLYDLDSSDVWYDLTSNTLGAFTLFLIHSIWRRLSRSFSLKLRRQNKR